MEPIVMFPTQKIYIRLINRYWQARTCEKNIKPSFCFAHPFILSNTKFYNKNFFYLQSKTYVPMKYFFFPTTAWGSCLLSQTKWYRKLGIPDKIPSKFVI